MQPLSKPPRAPVHPVEDTYFGQTLIDPYRWMENFKDEEYQAWLRAQSDYTRQFCDQLPLRESFLTRLLEVSDTGLEIRDITCRGKRYFYLKRSPGENEARLYYRNGLTGAEHLLVNPEARSSPEVHVSLSAYSVSPNGHYVSYLLSPGGGEYGDICVMRVDTAEELPDRIPNSRWMAGEWLSDNESFLYIYFPMFTSADPMERMQRLQFRKHTFGADQDQAILGYGVHPVLEIGTTAFPFVSVPPGSAYAIGVVNSGVSPNSMFYIVPVESLAQTPIPWQQVAGLEDEVKNVVVTNDTLYLLTYRDALRYKVLRTSALKPDLATATVVFQPAEAVAEEIIATADGLYIQVLEGSNRQIFRIAHGSSEAQPIDLPYQGTAQLVPGIDIRQSGLLFQMTSWTNSAALYRFDPDSGKVVNTRLIPSNPLDMSSIETISVKVAGHDGVLIPLTILQKRDLPQNGENPVLLEGYGAYGIVIPPTFSPHFLPWLERGGIVAFAGVRGGGEYGEEWHLAGKEATKPNTWLDFISCAEYLVQEKYTNALHLAGKGTSAGGILIGNAIAEHPGLFGAAWINVGCNNAIRMETTPNGLSNIAEFGTVTTEAGFRGLLAMDGFHKVRDGVAYPAVMLTHGINDPSVDVWCSAKMGARLQAATSSDRPVLVRIDYDGGHGIGQSKQQVAELDADIYAFLWAHLGGK